MSKPKKRDSLPLYVPKSKASNPEAVNSDDLVDGISDLSLKSVKSKKSAKKSSTVNGKVQPKTVVPDSWESISENDIGNEQDNGSDVQDPHSNSDEEEIVQQDAQFDYYTMPVDSNNSELLGLDHVIEVYDFMPSLQTADIAMPFASFKSEFRLKWVDDTHALGVFSSASLARRALGMEFLVFKVRPISEAASQSKIVAKKCGVMLRPVGDRPKTSASTARRMVANALGVRVNISKEQRDKERKELQEAKEQKKKEKLARVDPWKD